jgi:hypothetical protein
MAFCIDLGEEIAGDAMDMRGAYLGSTAGILAFIIGQFIG